MLIDTSIFKTREGRSWSPANGPTPSWASIRATSSPTCPTCSTCTRSSGESRTISKKGSIPYDKVVNALIEGGYDGYLTSEYEGPRDLYAGGDQIRRLFAMINRLAAGLS